MKMILNCAGDNELAKRLHDHLVSKIAPANDSGTAVDFISRNADEIEIWYEEAGVRKDRVRKAVEDFIASDSDLSGYSVTEFGDILTIGIKQSLDSIMLACEMCGYIAAHEDELRIHRMTHGLL